MNSFHIVYNMHNTRQTLLERNLFQIMASKSYSSQCISSTTQITPSLKFAKGELEKIMSRDHMASLVRIVRKQQPNS
uniref:Uncharacterized protein n=1 Tax=Rhizophora mucronata TaxID=61149 RepID=A0A2P2J4C6_RHIMU